MATEIELKLLATPADLRRLRKLPWLRAIQTARPRIRILRSTYFDTPDGRLRAAGVGLRIRDDGRRRVQTVKTAGESHGGMSVRGEWECVPKGGGIDLAALAETPVAALFAPELVAALRPVVRTTIARAELRVACTGADMLVAFDHGEVAAHRRQAPICEIEIELVRGPRRAVFDLAARFAAEAPLAVGHASKLERGLRLLAGTGPQPRRWDGSPVAPDMSAASALQAIARGCIAMLAANAEALLARQATEPVHQARVALRRLRAAIGLFRPLCADAETAAVTTELRWLQQQLGPARDIDVFLDEILAPVEAGLPEDRDLAQLRRSLVRLRRQHAITAAEALRSSRFTALMLTLGAWTEGGAWQDGAAAALQEPIESAAAHIIAPRERKLRKRVRRLDDMSVAERHALRIQVKKLRYACEFFLPVLSGKRTGRAVAALATLQDRLGLLNDMAVAHTLLREVLPARQARLQRAAGLVEGWHAACQPGALAAAARAGRNWRGLSRLVHCD